MDIHEEIITLEGYSGAYWRKEAKSDLVERQEI